MTGLRLEVCLSQGRLAAYAWRCLDQILRQLIQTMSIEAHR